MYGGAAPHVGNHNIITLLEHNRMKPIPAEFSELRLFENFIADKVTRSQGITDLRLNI